jgi:tetratricopeptide (TPR) repeat protein
VPREGRAYVFKHALTREVVYAGLAKPLRARLHAAVAEQIEHAAETPDEAASLLAHHYGEAVGLGDFDLIWSDEPARANGLRSKAVRWLSRAGVLAIRRFAIDDGLELLHRALAFEPTTAVKGEIWRAIGRAHAVRYAGDQAIEAYERAAELAPGPDQRCEIYAELAFETVQRYAMLNPLPPREVVDAWIERALASAPAATHARASALVARALWFADSDAAADEAVSISEELGDVELRSHAYNAKAVSAFVDRRYDDSVAWATRRLALADSISDPDHLVDIESMVIPGLLGRARFDEARRHAQLHDEAASRLSPHHQVHAVAMKLELEELTGRWDLMTDLAERARATVEANVDTPCVRNSRSLLACAVASAQLGDAEASFVFEQRAAEIAMAGYDAVFAPLRIRLALARGDLGPLEQLVGEALPPPPAKNWWTLCTEAARLDALAVLGDTTAVDAEAPPYVVSGTYLAPFALRALGVVHHDEALLDHARASFTAFGLDWFASQTLR